MAENDIVIDVQAENRSSATFNAIAASLSKMSDALTASISQLKSANSAAVKAEQAIAGISNGAKTAAASQDKLASAHTRAGAAARKQAQQTSALMSTLDMVRAGTAKYRAELEQANAVNNFNTGMKDKLISEQASWLLRNDAVIAAAKANQDYTKSMSSVSKSAADSASALEAEFALLDQMQPNKDVFAAYSQGFASVQSAYDRYQSNLTKGDTSTAARMERLNQLSQNRIQLIQELNTLEAKNASIVASIGQNGVKSLSANMSPEEVSATATALGEMATKSGQVNSATAALRSELDKLEEGMANTRYALYDASTTYGAFATALLGGGVAVVKTAADFQNAFAQVERTTGVVGQAAANLKNDLIDMSTQVATSFPDLSQVASEAGQLGVASTDVANFTKSVTAFSATTNVSIEDATTAFGQLNNLLPDLKGNYEGLASSILNTGVHAAATETQILSVAKELAPMASQYKITTDQVIGLSSAFASLGIAPEGARSAMQLTMQTINKAVYNGGESLANFAKVSGESSEEFANQWKTNSLDALKQFIGGLSQFNGSAGEMQNALTSLGIKEQRAQKGVVALAQNTGLLNTTLADSKSGLEDTSVLWDMFGIVTSTTSTKLKNAGIAIQNLFASLGESTLGPLSGVLDIFTGLTTAITKIIETPIGGWAAGTVLLFTTIKGAVFAYRTALALTIASIQGLYQAQTGLLSSTGSTRISLSTLKTMYDNLNQGMSLNRQLSGEVASGSDMATAAFDRQAAAAGRAAGAARTASTATATSIGRANTVIASSGTTATKSAGVLGRMGTAFVGLGSKAKSALSAVGKFMKANWITAVISIAIGLIFDFQGTLRDLASVAVWVMRATAKSFSFPLSPLMWLQKGVIMLLNVLSSGASGLADFASVASRFAGAIGMGGLSGSLSSAATTLRSWSLGLDTSSKAVSAFPQIIDMGADSLDGWVQAGNEAAKAADGAGMAQGDLGDEFGDGAADIDKNTGSTGKNSGAKDKNASAADRNRAALEALNDELERQQAILDKSIRTTKDYASDVSGIWTEAFGVTTGAFTAQKAIADGWADITKNAESARDAMADANATLMDLTADRDILEYQLRVAEAYGDEMRAAKIRAELAENTQKQSKATSDLASAQKDLSKSTGISSMIDMTTKYGDMVTALLNAGYAGDDLQSALDGLVSDFKDQANAAGFGGDEVARFSRYLQSFSQVAKKVPAADITFGVRYGSQWLPTVSAFSSTVDNEIGSWAIQNKDFLLEAGWQMPDGSSKSLKDYWKTQVDAFNAKNRLEAEIKIRQSYEDATAGSGAGGSGGAGGGVGGGAGGGGIGGVGGGPDSGLDTGQDAASSGWDSFFSGMGSWWNGLITNISTWWSGLVTNVGTWWNNLITGIQGWWNTNIGEPISQWWAGFTGIIDEQIVQPWAAFFAMLDRIWNQIIVPAWQLVTGWIQDTWNTYVATPFNNAISWIQNTWNTYVATPFNNVISWIQNAWNTYVAQPFARVSAWIQNAWNTYVAQPFQRISAAIQWAWDAYVAQPFGRVVSNIQWAWNAWVVDPFNRVSAGIQRTWDWAVSAISNFNPGRFFTNLWNSVLPGKATGGAIGEKAVGGSISGPGTGTSDTAGLFALSNGEHVLTASDVKKMGGQGAVYALRAAVQSGKSITGFATGGQVNVARTSPVIRVAGTNNQSSVVSLDSSQLALLVNAVSSQVTQVVMDSKVVAEANRKVDSRENRLDGKW